MATAEPILFGPFELLRLLGHGGGGSVWLGRHRDQQMLVAVKVMSATGADKDAFRARFVQEVRSVARLDHPGIVTIIDHGQLDARTAAAMEGATPAGSPYLVMENARWGTLPSLEPLTNFGELRRILIAILDALAHAHARGVIHRDIKPGNVLVTQKDRRRPALKLTDFGIAYAIDAPPKHRSSATLRIRAGTPSYMAPEQIRGDLKNQGPWTDLYALGCLAYRLATRRTPFSVAGRDVDQILQAHLHGIVPPMTSRFALPIGFGEWIANLLAKAPWDRYQCCADALHALRKLNEFPSPQDATARDAISGELMLEESQDETISAETQDETNTVTLTGSSATFTTSDVPASARYGNGEPQTRQPAAELAPPPPPESWRRPEPPPKSLHIVGAGLGLFGLRSVPFTGRDSERDAMWAMLRSVQSTGEPALVVIRGSGGVGKSRLVEWIAQRAVELGCANLLKATHSSFPSSADGIPHMLAQTFRAVGLSRNAMELQVRHVLDNALIDADRSGEDDTEYLSLALAELIWPRESEGVYGGGHGSPAVHFGSQAQRYAVVRRLLERQCRRRPVLLWLDDVQWGREALAFAHWLIETPGRLPVMLLLTVRDEELAERPLEEGLLARLKQAARSETLSLKPMNTAEQLELVRGMLGLEQRLAEQVQQRTAGNPLFAVQLVGDWVERGVLEVGPKGFRLREGEEAQLPDDIHDMWRRRLELLASKFDEGAARQSLEVAAALGVDIDANEWTLACALSGSQVPEGMLEVMVERRLAERTDLGWCFAHNLLRESLERTARKEQRWQGHHRACVRALRELHGDDAAHIAERIGLHLLAAGDSEAALEPLLSAADLHQRHGDFDRGLGLCEKREAALKALDVPKTDDRWARGWLLIARCYYKQADFDKAVVLLDKVEGQLRDDSPSPHRATMYRIRAQVTRMRGDMLAARELAAKAAAEFERVGDPPAAADCDIIVARLHFETVGDPQHGIALAESARQRLRELGDLSRIAECTYIMGHLHLVLGDPDLARRYAIEALGLYEKVGNRYGAASCANFRGEIARDLGELEEAEEHYHTAIAMLESIGSKTTFVPRLNLALTQVQRGTYAEAEPLLLSLQHEGKSGMHGVLCFVHYALLCCYADVQDWPGWDEQFSAAREFRPETGRVDQDLGRLAMLAGDVLTAADDEGRARQSYELALAHYQALDRQDKTSQVTERLEKLE